MAVIASKSSFSLFKSAPSFTGTQAESNAGCRGGGARRKLDDESLDPLDPGIREGARLLGIARPWIKVLKKGSEGESDEDEGGRVDPDFVVDEGEK